MDIGRCGPYKISLYYSLKEWHEFIWIDVEMGSLYSISCLKFRTYIFIYKGALKS